MKKLNVIFTTVIVALFSVFNGLLPLVQAEDKPFDGEEVVIGVVGDSSEQVWRYIAEEAAKEGITIDVKLLTDYNTPNASLVDGSLDLNAFQHVAFLEEWNKANDEDLVHIGYTTINPLRLYSQKVSSVEELEDGAVIGIPNDPTNGGRALLALEIAGLIEVDDEAGVLPTVDDITKNDKNIVIEELDASQIGQALADLDAGILNVGFANDAGLDPKDALFSDGDDLDELNDIYKNVIVVRKEDEDNPLYKHIVELYQTPEVAKLIVETSNGGGLPAFEVNE
ncbi:MetQ/NlpA family ABC transporter substrate-binding protein [Dolosicoccus paucivorans]|uniref:Lipoprotein n=1 Tax=Dolosicoccus paucivorans TaxID=84521 RepID=A0A1G8L7E9_9LACT|nr:MetQ/NlpA family ABC transporter substrate-binding protein [Dolosicoccus paucivorans]PMB84240.1 methionine ABC transporter substrate-binding protein [Dolosicoccus paucivorans]PMC58514.1 methionine ABC transporter substrate-binding protein [Dolosicoccus paucivorans]SDI51180.1 D-methionine transport system substrate-binding protein [Dolosicoccus paucivorans]